MAATLQLEDASSMSRGPLAMSDEHDVVAAGLAWVCQ